ncbi:MAG: hypothetical protein Q9175_005041 [Cornicularia normoerica]
MSQKRVRSISPASVSSIFRSSSIEDRSSTFIAFYSPTLAAEELQAHTEFKSASHRIAAWRKSSSQRALNAQRLMETGHDDDGEKYGGKALEKVLIETEVEGAVVVARWYGGVMLGPVRFDHIKICARNAIMQWSQDMETSAKKARVREDEAEKERLILTLPERDHSITVLRDLLAERNQQFPSAPGGKSNSANTPDYSTLPLVTLEKLERVRDATIGWILKQIEKAEKPQVEEPGVKSAATSTTSETQKASAQFDEHPAKDEESKVADVDGKNTKTAPPKLDGV